MDRSFSSLQKIADRSFKIIPINSKKIADRQVFKKFGAIFRERTASRDPL